MFVAVVVVAAAVGDMVLVLMLVAVIVLIMRRAESGALLAEAECGFAFTLASLCLLSFERCDGLSSDICRRRCCRVRGVAGPRAAHRR